MLLISSCSPLTDVLIFISEMQTKICPNILLRVILGFSWGNMRRMEKPGHGDVWISRHVSEFLSTSPLSIFLILTHYLSCSGHHIQPLVYLFMNNMSGYMMLLVRLSPGGRFFIPTPFHPGMTTDHYLLVPEHLKARSHFTNNICLRFRCFHWSWMMPWV